MLWSSVRFCVPLFFVAPPPTPSLISRHGADCPDSLPFFSSPFPFLTLSFKPLRLTVLPSPKSIGEKLTWPKRRRKARKKKRKKEKKKKSRKAKVIRICRVESRVGGWPD